MNKKTKVLFLLEAFDKGGIEKVTLDIVNNLDPEKYDITVQAFWFGGHCQSQVKPHVKVIPFFFRRYVRGVIRLIDYLSPKMLYRLFVHGDYDVEIACSDGGAAKVISGSTNKHARKVCWVHMDVVQRGSKLKEFANADTARPIYEKFDIIVPVSCACKDTFFEKCGNDYPFQVVRNPMPFPEILAKTQAFVPNFPSEPLNILCVGRLVEQKGFDRLLDAAAQVKKTIQKPFHIHILGDGPLRAALEAQSLQLGLEHTVSFLGFCDNPYPYLKHADAFMLSSPTHFKSRCKTTSRNWFNISWRCLGSTLNNCRFRFCYNFFMNNFSLCFISISTGHHGNHISFSGGCFLPYHLFCRIPRIVINILSFCLILLIIHLLFFCYY